MLDSPPFGAVWLYYKRLIGVGGAERQLLEEYSYLAERGHAAVIVTMALRDQALLDYNPQLLCTGERGVVDNVRTLRRLIRRFQPRVISAHSGHREIYLATRGTGTKYLYHHNSPVLLQTYKDPAVVQSWIGRRRLGRLPDAEHSELSIPHRRACGFARPIDRLRVEGEALVARRAVRAAHAVLCLSNQAAAEISAFYRKQAYCVRGCLSERLLNHQPGGRPEPLRRLQSPLILSVSRLSKEKRLDLVIEAFRNVRRQVGGSLIIVGEGPEESKLRALASASESAGHIEFPGFIPESDLWDWLAACDVFASPAWADFDIAPYEALALSRKVVWSSEMETDPAIRDCGLIFQAEPTAGAFAEAILEAVRAPLATRPDLSRLTWSERFDFIYGRLLGEEMSRPARQST